MGCEVGRLAAALCLILAGGPAQARQLRAVVVAGEGDHDWPTTTSLIERALVNSGRFEISPSGPNDVVVLNHTARPARPGQGKVVVHAGSGEHGPRRVITVRYTAREHPVARGLAATFLTTDSLYTTIQPGPRAQVIAVDDETKQPVIWTEGRACFIALGHDAPAAYETGFLTAVARGAEWAATGAVAGSAEVAYDRRDPKAVRVLVVTGGHAFDTAFGSLFEGQPDVAPFVYPRNVAFTRDIRPGWDVLVLYDLTLAAGETEKKVLRDFLESGKGLVLLHHAIADHADWPWWYEEVAGGKYFTKPEGSREISLFKQDQEIVVRATGDHPVTRGAAPLHLWEETYKNMWISPRVKPLLETDHPASDRYVAWISPYEKSRVIYIQLGHDRKSHMHPGYRALVRNAVLWAAGRISQ